MALYAPFPVEVPYRTGPTMTKLGSGRVPDGSGQLFIVDEAYERYLEQKLAHLSLHPERYGGLSAGTHEGLGDALLHVFSLLAQEQPGLVSVGSRTIELRALGLRLRLEGRYAVENDAKAPLEALGRRVKTHLESQPNLTKLVYALALSVQEDFVVLRDLGGADEAEYLCVAFPSHWDPRTKVGQDFAEVHRPVANNAALLKSHRPVMNALFHKGPFVRFVWGLSADGRLGQHPAEVGTSLPQEVVCASQRLAANLFFRTERQVSVPLLEFGRCLFTVRVAVQPLEEALRSDERRRRLAAALESMNDELLTYKGLKAWRDPLLAYLNP